MEWTYTGVFTVYSVGDGLFMKRVLDAVAALSNSGVLASLGALGLMLGLLLVGMRGAATGGKQFDLGSLFVSFIIYLIMFAGKADVIIQDVGLSPGESTENVYTVDNIPFGVAFLGSAISTIGVEITERIEQAYGMPNEVQSLRSVGFGRSLDWLAAVRFARTTDTNNTNSAFQRYRRNLVNYMRYCSAQVIAREPERAPRMLNSADPLDATTGFGFSSNWVTTPYFPSGGGAETDLTCSAALTNLQAYRTSQQGFSDWANAVAGPMGYSGTTSAVNQAQSAFAAMNIAADDAQNFMLAAVANAAWRDALTDMPVIGSEQTMHTIMMTQAVEQQATQFAGEESMFRRIMRPLMAFLESMVFAVAPFMAMAVGLGRAGLGMIGKYCIITLWVALWMPTLSMINMFQTTMAERAIETVMSPPGGAAGYAIGSMAGAAKIEDVVIDWLGTGAMLAASTPMITLVLLFGTAMPLIGLAGAFKGGDVIDEKQVSPDAAKVGPAMNHGPGYQYTRGGGVVESGASVPQFEFGRSAQIAQESARMDMSSSANRMESKFGQEIASAIQHDMTRGVGASSRGEMRMSQTEARASEAVGEKVAGFESISASAQRMVMATASSTDLGARLDIGSATKAIAGMLGGTMEKLGAEKGEQYMQQLAKSLKLGAGGDISARDSVDRVAESMARMSENVRSAMRNSDSVKAEVLGASSDTVEQLARENGTASQRVTGSSGFSEMKEDLQQKQQSYREATTANESAGMRQSVPLNEVAQRLTKSGLAPEAIRAAQELGSPAAFSAAVNQLAHSGKFGELNTNRGQIEAAAAAMVLNDSVPAGPPMNQALAGDRAQALMGFLTESGAVNTGAGYRAAVNLSAAASNENIVSDVEQGEATRNVESANVGAAPGTSAGAVQGYTSLGTAQGQAAASENAARVAGVKAAAVSEGQATAEGNVNEAGYTTFANQREAAVGPQVQNTAQSGALQLQANRVVHPGAAFQEANNSAVDMAGEGVTGVGMGTGLNRVLGVAAQGGLTDSFINYEALGLASPEPPSPSPLLDFGVLRENAEAGAYTNGKPVSGDAATVLAAIAAENRGTPLSQEQRDEASAAFSNLSMDDRSAIRNIDDKWAYGQSHPSLAPMASSNELSRGSRDGEDGLLVDGPLNGVNYQELAPSSVAKDYLGVSDEGTRVDPPTRIKRM